MKIKISQLKQIIREEIEGKEKFWGPKHYAERAGNFSENFEEDLENLLRLASAATLAYEYSTPNDHGEEENNKFEAFKQQFIEKYGQK